MLWMTIVPWLSTASLSLIAVAYEPLITQFTFEIWLAFFAVSVFSMGLAITPTTFISLVGGYFLGMSAVLPVILSYQLASLLGYFLAKKIDNQTVDLIIEKFPAAATIINNVERRQWMTTFLARISPALPFGLMNVVLAISGVRPSPFFFGGLVGMLPRTLLFIAIGSQAAILMEALQTDDYLIWFILLSIIGLYALFKLLIRR